MSLLQLSPEILIQIMDDLGSSYFREDLGRLTICKQWFRCALTAYFKDLQLSQRTLQRLLSSWHVEKNTLLIKANLEILDLELKGFEDWYYIPEPQQDADADALDASIRDRDLATWTTTLDNNLVQLAKIIKKSRRLRTIRIQASSERNPLIPHLLRRDYLSLSTIRDLLQVENLAVLELDLCGTLLTPREEHAPDDFHICKSIGALLTTLKSLRLRMRSICADVLKPQDHGTTLNLRLNKVIINLSLSNESPMTTSATHSKPCASTDGGGRFLTLKAEIEDQAEALAAHMASPDKIIRVLTHSFPKFQMRSLDVLTGKCMVLADDMAWEDDGNIVEEESESEMLDDGSSISSDE